VVLYNKLKWWEQQNVIVVGKNYERNRECGRNEDLWERTKLWDSKDHGKNKGLWVIAGIMCKNRIVGAKKDNGGLGLIMGRTGTVGEMWNLGREQNCR
jgi:hypothetical protein